MDDPLLRARALLAREGMHAELSVAGAEGEILVVRVGAAMRRALARAAPEIRAIGFRYVTIEIEAGVQ